jgi:hypothetical protein
MTSRQATRQAVQAIWSEGTRQTVVVAPDARNLSELCGRRLSVLDRMLANWRGFSLDALLAAGASPDSDRMLAARASALVNLPRRRKLANDWGRLVKMASERPAASVRIPLRRAQVVEAGPEILQLQDSLRAALPVPVRGVAMANHLLTDATGPVYSRKSLVDLRVALRDAIRQMDPQTALLPDEPYRRTRG